MVRHEHIGVELTSLLIQRHAQPRQVSVIVFFAKEAGITVVPALDDVQGYAIEVNAGTTRHDQTLAEKMRA